MAGGARSANPADDPPGRLSGGFGSGIVPPTTMTPLPPSNSHRPALLALAAGLAFALGAQARTTPAPAPTAQPGADVVPQAAPVEPDSLDDRLIREIQLRQPVPRAPGAGPNAPAAYGPLEAALEQLVLNQIRSRTGAPYSRKEISGDITRINRLARFKQVDVRGQLLDDGSVRLIYTLLPQSVIADVQISGNKLFNDIDIARDVEILTGTPIDEWEIDRACRRIEAMYRAKGYFLARVRVDRDELAKSNVVLFEITEGERTRVREIRFEGNKSFAADELRLDLKTREYMWPLESGPLDEETIDNDVAQIRTFYKDHGYLNARVDRSILTSPDAKEAIVTFIVDEDMAYTMRTVEVEYPEHREVFSTKAEADEFAGPAGLVEEFNEGPQKRWRAVRPGPLDLKQVMGHMLIKPGDVYSADKLNKSVRAIEEALGKLGYCGDPDAPPGADPNASSRVTIVRRELRDKDKPLVDVLLVIRGVKKPYLVGEVKIIGDPITQGKVIRRLTDATLEPGRPLDGSQIALTQKRIDQTSLFRPDSVKITLQRPDPEEPDYRDVLIKVEETNTGSIIFGGLVGSDGGASAQISFRQRNFDVADLPDTWGELFAGRAFRGAGQVFSVDLLPGNLTQNYQISLTEPNLFETNTGGGAALYYKGRKYDEYTENRLGGQFNLARKLGDRWNFTLPIRGEQISLSNIDPGNAQDYFDVENDKVLTSVGFTLTRTNIDDPYVPSKGNKLSFGFEQVGALGGDFTFNIFAGEAGLYIPLYEDFFGRRTVLSFNNKIKYIPQDEKDVPVYERFYLGGQSVRGFGFRTISPRGIRHDTGVMGDDPVGGTFSFNFNTEVKQPIFEDLLSFVVFSDSGTVNNAVSLANYRVSVGVGLRLHVKQLSPVPLAFDFGIPVIKELGDRRRVFTFNVDIPF